MHKSHNPGLSAVCQGLCILREAALQKKEKKKSLPIKRLFAAMTANENSLIILT